MRSGCLLGQGGQLLLDRFDLRLLLLGRELVVVLDLHFGRKQLGLADRHELRVRGFDEAGILAIQRGPLLRELGNIVVEVPRLVFIKNVEQRDKFPIHPGRRAIRLAGASRRHNDCADEPRIGLAH